MTDELPEGWTQRCVEDLFRSFSGGTPSKDNRAFWGGDIPWLSSGDIKADRISAGSEFITQAGLENSSSKLCRPGSVLIVVRSGILKHTLPVSVLAQEAAINQDIKCFDSGRDDLNSWLALALRAFSQDILALNREGTTVQSVKYDTLRHFQLPIPPLPEQKRIVEKLEKLLAEVEQCKERMAKIPVLLKRFRQSVLAAACSGRLTADWREQRNAPDEALLEEEKYPFPIPSSWEWRSFNQVAREITVGYVGPMAKEYVPSGIPFLRSLNVRPFRFDPTDLKFISREFHKRIKKSRLAPGDVAIVRSGNSGIACVIPESLTEANCSDLVILRPAPELIAQYACIFLNSNVGRAHVNAVKVGIAQGHFNVGSMKTTLLPLPPASEQQEIVNRVEKLFALADNIEERHKGAKKQVDGLTQSILAKAFRGELVPTESELAAREGRSYESASQLLQRILASKTENETGGWKRAGQKRRAV